MDEYQLNINDFVILLENIGDIQKNAVGLITNIDREEIATFFIGKRTTIYTNKENLALLDVTQTGKPRKVKICNICHILKDEIEFDINQTDAKGRKTTRPSCKVCRTAIDGKHLTKEDSKKMDKIKPTLLFTCPICEKTSIVGVTANIVKDHNHQTGAGREWICDSCNTGLGRFKDDVVAFERIISYLQRYNGN